MKSHSRRLQNLKGFSLLEALIAFLVVAVGLLALAQFHGAALFSSADAKARTQAANLAEAKMSELRSYYSVAEFETLASSGSPETAADTATDLGVSGMDWVESFQRSWTITGEYIGPYECDGSDTPCASPPCACPDAACTDPANTEGCHQKRIEVTVSWTDAHGVAQSINLESIIEGVESFYAGRALRTTTTTSTTATTGTTSTTGTTGTTSTTGTTGTTSTTETTAVTTTTTTTTTSDTTSLTHCTCYCASNNNNPPIVTASPNDPPDCTESTCRSNAPLSVIGPQGIKQNKYWSFTYSCPI